MRTTIRTLLLGTMVFAALAGGRAQTSSCPPADEAAVRQLVKDFAASWPTHNAARYAAFFAEDANWENAFGDRKRGRKEIEDGMTPVVQTFSTAEETVTEVRVECLRPDLALVDIYEMIEGQKTPKGVPIPTRHVRLSQIHEKRDGKWTIRVHRVADLRGFNKQPGADQEKQKSASPTPPPS